MPRTSTGRRATHACARCRRQKLRCDDSRPCLLCIRSGAVCEEQGHHPAPHRTPRPPRSLPPRTPRRVASPENNRNNVTTAPRAARERTGGRARRSRQFGANSSVVQFAMDYLESQDEDMATIPGDIEETDKQSEIWNLTKVQVPPLPVVDVLLEAYFHRVHWFVNVLHEGTFAHLATGLLSRKAWRRDQMSEVMAAILVCAIGLRCARYDGSWPGHAVLRRFGVDPERFIDGVISEIRLRIMDILEDSQLATVQTCALIGTYSIYHGSPNVAWSYMGLAVRSAYGQGMQCEPGRDVPDARAEAEKRCWNHVIVTDTYASLMFGRPWSLDPAFAQPHPIHLCDDASVPTSLLSLFPDEPQDSPPISRLTFHRLKSSLYMVQRNALSRFRLFALRSTITEAEFHDLVEATKTVQSELSAWKSTVPPMFAFADEEWPAAFFRTRETLLPTAAAEDERRIAEQLMMQGAVLQLVYDAAIILSCRPMLDRRLSLSAPVHLSKAGLASLPNVLRIAVDAAIRISHQPVELFRHQFSMPFLAMHFFTAGVILCIPAVSFPLTALALEAKAGVVRIIRACRQLRRSCRIARHTEGFLARLLRLSAQREMEQVLEDPASELIATDGVETPSTIAEFGVDDHRDRQRPPTVGANGVATGHSQDLASQIFKAHCAAAGTLATGLQASGGSGIGEQSNSDDDVMTALLEPFSSSAFGTNGATASHGVGGNSGGGGGASMISLVPEQIGGDMRGSGSGGGGGLGGSSDPLEWLQMPQDLFFQMDDVDGFLGPGR